MLCENCGNENDESARFCYRCGTPLSSVGQINPVNSGAPLSGGGPFNPVKNARAAARERGGCLNAYLGFMTVSFPLSAIYYLVHLDEVNRYLQLTNQWLITLMGILAVIGFVCAIALWNWRKWGFYGLCGLAFAAFAINILMHLPIISCLLGLAGPILTYFLLRPVWRLMK